ncbi:DNA excision repair protein ERCC-1 [Selaginella moellendorffii]|uniref:DNA excision repair protein ERCC-1 n=1 Tax=Selaginella moellendorffii TaxID=88036 RepID=UPI000D1C29C2|nr:DNA excision repair protein ERCC-1 [Selaginella moellendorffii]|eukprot:XP_024534027.1 DNA excision repair protein ERCC-1 [Selaginella moellendorffii]
MDGEAPRQQSFGDAFSFVRQGAFYSAPAPPPSGSAPAGAASGASNSQSRNAILVSRRQQGNPVLKFIRNVRWTFDDIVPDYVLGQSSCALYLSIRYHLLHPDYLYFRIRELQKNFRLRVVLCYVDVEDVIKPLHEVTKTALLHDCSLLCAWSLEECARYLETIKMYENKPADNIQERTDQDYLSRLTSALTSVRHINKTDVVTLGSTFGSMASVMSASMEDLARCPGIGERKVKRLYDAFHEPFRRTSKQLRLSSVGIKPIQEAPK